MLSLQQALGSDNEKQPTSMLLYVDVDRACGLQNTQYFSEQDPFVKISLKGESRCTKAVDEGGEINYIIC